MVNKVQQVITDVPFYIKRMTKQSERVKISPNLPQNMLIKCQLLRKDLEYLANINKVTVNIAPLARDPKNVTLMNAGPLTAVVDNNASVEEIAQTMFNNFSRKINETLVDIKSNSSFESFMARNGKH